MRISSFRWKLVIVAALTPLVQAAEPAPPPVQRWVLIPRVNLGAAYDANVYRTPTDAISDVYLEPELSLDYASSTETNQWNLRGTVFGAHRAYAREDTEDFEVFGEELRLGIGGAGPGRWELIQSFRRIEDADRHTPNNEFVRLTLATLQDVNSQSERRDIFDAGATYQRRLSDKSETTVAYRYAAVDFDRPTYLDLSSHLVQAEYAYGISDKSAVFANVQYGAEEQDQGGESADVIKGRLGLSTRGADKVVGRAGVGLQQYDRTRTQGDEEENAASFDLSLEWQASEKVMAYGGMNNGSQLSSLYEENALDYINSWIGMVYRWTPLTTVGLRGSYRRDAYLDSVLDQGVERTRRDQRFLAAARIDYRAPSDRWGIFLQLSQEHVVSTLDSVEYDNTLLSLETRMAY